MQRTKVWERRRQLSCRFRPLASSVWYADLHATRVRCGLGALPLGARQAASTQNDRRDCALRRSRLSFRVPANRLPSSNVLHRLQEEPVRVQGIDVRAMESVGELCYSSSCCRSHLRQKGQHMRASLLILMLVLTTGSVSASEKFEVAAANGRADFASSRSFTPIPGTRVSQSGCRIPDRCVDARGQWICPCTAEAKACGFCGRSN